MIWIFVLIIILDQATKYYFADHSVANQGIGAGLFNDSPLFIWMLLGIVFLALVLYLIHKWRSLSKAHQYAWLAVVGGATSNFIDRVEDNAVSDIIPLFWSWRINIADIAITMGVIVLLFLAIKKR